MRTTVIAALALCAGCQPVSKVHFANWAGEIGPDSLAQFAQRQGIEVVTEDLVDNVTLQTRLLAGGSGIDVAVPASNFLGPLIQAGALQPIDRSLLSNWRHLDPEILRGLERLDPGNRYSVPYVWGTQGFAYDVATVKRSLGALPPDSWRLIFDPKYAAKLAGCGIAWQDGAGSIMMDLALLAMGRDPAAEDAEGLAAAEQAFMTVRPYVRYIDSSGRSISDLASGEICIAIGANGELSQAARLARALRRDGPIRYVLPEEGSLLWVDLLVIPRDAPHRLNAHRLIDHLLDPRVAADVANASRYATANASAAPWLEEDLRNDRTSYPARSDFARLHLVPAESQAYSRQRTRSWTRIKNATSTGSGD